MISKVHAGEPQPGPQGRAEGQRDTHEMCTGNPALFSAVPIPQSQFDNDLQVIAKCHVPVFRPKSCSTDEPNAVNDIVGRVWRTAHPNAFGQQDIARAVESQLGTL